MEDNFDSNQSGNRIIKSIIHFFIKMINIIFMCKIAKKSSKKAPNVPTSLRTESPTNTSSLAFYHASAEAKELCT